MRRGGRAPGHLEWRRGRPRRIQEVHAAGTGKGVAAALGDGIDDAAGEAAVLGGNTGGENLGFLDGIFNEQVLGLRELVVVDVHAVDHEHVVEGKSAVDDQLPGIGRVLTDRRRELGDSLNGARRRQQLDFLVLEIGADDRRGDRSRYLGHDPDGLGDAGRAHRDGSVQPSGRGARWFSGSPSRIRSARPSPRSRRREGCRRCTPHSCR